MAYSGSRSR
ncbi:hypothetical protein YPPY36_1096, partial [Yersinia pestis PY-36]